MERQRALLLALLLACLAAQLAAGQVGGEGPAAAPPGHRPAPSVGSPWQVHPLPVAGPRHRLPELSQQGPAVAFHRQPEGCNPSGRGLLRGNCGGHAGRLPPPHRRAAGASGVPRLALLPQLWPLCPGLQGCAVGERPGQRAAEHPAALRPRVPVFPLSAYSPVLPCSPCAFRSPSQPRHLSRTRPALPPHAPSCSRPRA